jgi:hypothetical protein
MDILSEAWPLMKHPNREILLDVGDGPEGITIYTDPDKGAVDWSGHEKPLYIEVSMWGASASFGPFDLDSIRQQLVEKLSGPSRDE